MSFSSEENKKQYAGNDSTTVFSFPYLFQANTDLTVIITDADENDITLELDVDYSVVGAGLDEPAGSVTYPIGGDPLATGQKITIVREMDPNQETDLSNHGAFFLESIEKALDKTMMSIQQIQEAIDRCVKVDITDTDPPPSVTDFNTALETVEALEAAFDNLVVQNHSAVASGGQTVFAMPGAWPDLDSTSNVTVYDDGLKIDRDDYSVTDDDEITFDSGRTVGHTIIFELNEALSSDDLDAAIAAAVTPYNVIINSDPFRGDYNTFAEYLADSPQNGDSVLIETTAVITATLVISNSIEITEASNAHATFSVNTNFSPILQLENNVKINGNIHIDNNDTGTIAVGVLFAGERSFCDNIIIHNNNTGTITDLVKINSAEHSNYAQIRAINDSGGTITNYLNDASTNNRNNVTVIGASELIRSNGANKFEGDEFEGENTSFSVVKSGNQTGIVTDTWTKLTWETEIFDLGGYFASSKYTPLKAGKYLFTVSAAIVLGLTDGEEFLCALYKNGVKHKENRTISARSASPGPFASLTVIVDANGTTDYFEVFVFHTHGSDKVIDGGADETYFMGVKVDR